LQIFIKIILKPAMASSLTPAVLSYIPPDPPLKEFEPPRDRAFFADPAKNSLLSTVLKVEHLTPYIGTELKGVQVSQLTDAQKDELALLVAEVCYSKAGL
jgi:sulfonate dioxygenase